MPIKIAPGIADVMGATVEERRQNVRHACSLKVRYRLDEEGAVTMDTVGLNISERGIFLRPAGGLLEGQRIRMRFTLPDKTEIRNARAVVVRQEPLDCVAVMFISVHPNVQENFG